MRDDTKAIMDLALKDKKCTGVLTTLGEGGVIKGVPVIPTGIPDLDVGTGIGGIPEGRIIEIYGGESSSKTTTLYSIIANAQRLGHMCGMVDPEQAADPAWMQVNGVDVDNLLFNQPDCAEEGLEMVEFLIKNGAKVIGIDSVSALVPRAEIEGDFGDSHMGLQARLMGQAMRKLTSVVSKHKAVAIFLNQTRCIPKQDWALANGKIMKFGNIKRGDIIPMASTDTRVNDVLDTGVVNGVEIKTKLNKSYKISDNHRQPIIRGDNYCECDGLNIKVGDWLINPKQNISFCDKNYVKISDIYQESIKIKSNAKKVKMPKVLNEDLAMFMGMYCADGSMGSSPKGSKMQFTEISLERHKLVVDLANKLFNNVHVNGCNISIGGVRYYNLFTSLGLKRGRVNKVIPNVILESKFSIIRAFVRGLSFDTELLDKCILFTPFSNKIGADALAYIFSLFNIRCSRKVSETCEALAISCDDAIRYNTVFGFSESSKTDIINRHKVQTSARGAYDVVPCRFAHALAIKISKSKFKNKSSNKNYVFCRSLKYDKKVLNVSRVKLIDTLRYFNLDHEYDKDIDFLDNNRFDEIKSIKSIEFDSVSIETDSGYFNYRDIYTHNSKIGVTFGSPVTTSGGNALKFFSSMRIQTRKTITIKQNAEDKEGIGIGVEFKFVKNKLAPPYKIATGTLMFDSGFSFATNLFNAMLGNKDIENKGAWYYYKGKTLGQGAIKSIAKFGEMYKDQLDEMYDDYVDARLGGGEFVEETVESLKAMLKETEDEKEIKDIRKRMKALGGKK